MTAVEARGINPEWTEEELARNVLSEEMFLEVQKSLSLARASLYYAFPYFDEIASNLRFIPDYRLPTAGVDKLWNFYYNPKFIAMLTYGEVIGVVAHELLHLWSRHHARWTVVSGGGTKERDRTLANLWNYAADASLNTELKTAFGNVRDIAQLKASYPRLPDLHVSWEDVPDGEPGILTERGYHHFLDNYERGNLGDKNMSKAFEQAMYRLPANLPMVYNPFVDDFVPSRVTIDGKDIAHSGGEVEFLLGEGTHIIAAEDEAGKTWAAQIDTAIRFENVVPAGINARDDYKRSIQLQVPSIFDLNAYDYSVTFASNVRGSQVYTFNKNSAGLRHITSDSITVELPNEMVSGVYVITLSFTGENGASLEIVGELAVGTSSDTFNVHGSVVAQDGYQQTVRLHNANLSKKAKVRLLGYGIDGKPFDTGLVKSSHVLNNNYIVVIYNELPDNHSEGYYTLEISHDSRVYKGSFPMGLGEGSGDGSGASNDGQDCGSGVGGDSRDWDQEGDPDDEGVGVPEHRQDRILNRTAEKISEHARVNGRGSVAGGWLREAETILTKQTNWKRELDSIPNQVKALTGGMDDFSTSRPNLRKEHMSTNGIIFPRMVSNEPPLIDILIDTSGSMSTTDLGVALGTAHALERFVRNTRSGMRVRSCDAETAEPKFVRNMKEIELIGGGGTDMRIGMDAIAKERLKSKMVIVATDGETPWPERKPMTMARARFIALIINENRNTTQSVPSWMNVIYIDPRELPKSTRR